MDKKLILKPRKTVSEQIKPKPAVPGFEEALIEESEKLGVKFKRLSFGQVISMMLGESSKLSSSKTINESNIKHVEHPICLPT